MKPYSGFISSSRQGTIYIPWNKLVKLIGPPHCVGDMDKSDGQWDFILPGKSFISIWNYKNGPNYDREIKSVAKIKELSVYWSGDAGRKKLKKLFGDNFVSEK